jgi:hypothetical protein
MLKCPKFRGAVFAPEISRPNTLDVLPNTLDVLPNTLSISG